MEGKKEAISKPKTTRDDISSPAHHHNFDKNERDACGSFCDPKLMMSAWKLWADEIFRRRKRKYHHRNAHSETQHSREEEDRNQP